MFWRAFKRACQIITFGNLYGQKVYRFLPIFMMCFLLMEMVLRYVFNSPTNWSFLLTGMLVGPYWVFCTIYTMAGDQHIRLDMIYQRLSLRKQGIIDCFTWLFFWFYLGIICYYGWGYFWDAFTNQTRYVGTWAPLVWPWRLTVPVTCFLMLLQGIVKYTTIVHKAVTGKELDLLGNQNTEDVVSG